MISKRLLGVLLVSSTLQFVACNQAISDQSIDAEINQVVHQTVSASASLIQDARISRTKSRVEADWQIATKLSQQEYFDSLKKTLHPGYQVVQQTDSKLILRRLFPGDAYEVRVTPANVSGQQLAINVHFVAMPD